MSKLNKEEFISALKEMSVLELNELVKAIEEEFGVTAAAQLQLLVVLQLQLKKLHQKLMLF